MTRIRFFLADNGQEVYSPLRSHYIVDPFEWNNLREHFEKNFLPGNFRFLHRGRG
jgi:hypothetical protein